MTRNWQSDPRNKSNQPFGGVDGEGGNIPDPKTLFGTSHEYLLLRADTQVLHTGKPLTYQECFDFIAGLSRQVIWSAFSFDYDVTMMCKGIPEERARRLFDETLRQSPNGFVFRDIEIDNTWRIGYIPRKEFKVARSDEVVRGSHGAQFSTVSDSFGFFQGSFVKTLEKWGIGTPEQKEQIQKGKNLRAEFGEMTQEIIDYNKLECFLQAELMEKFRDVCREVGYVPRRWQGAGQLATAMLQAHGVPRREDIPAMANERFRALANNAYYGGRFETTAVGPVPGPVYQYDINGAYVAALCSLPCLIHSTWKYVREMPPPGTLWVGELSFKHPFVSLLYHLPVRRKDGGLFFPKEGTGYYWSTEVHAACRWGTQIQFHSGWVYSTHCECRPFQWIPAYYQKRLSLGKSDRGYVLKLGGNSIYGKIAQSIGNAPYANPVWAGLITAWCRAKIIETYGAQPEDCYMIMTDGLFMASIPKGLRGSKDLGGWDVKCHDSLFIIQPGLYFLPGDAKTRGVPHGKVVELEQEFRDAADGLIKTRYKPKPIPVPVENFITMRQALARRKWHIAGTWEHTTRDIGFEWDSKRLETLTQYDYTHGQDKPIFRTLPIVSSVNVASIPYSKIIGGGIGDNIQRSPFARYTDPALEEMEYNSEQPDWQPPLFDTNK